MEQAEEDNADFRAWQAVTLGELIAAMITYTRFA